MCGPGRPGYTPAMTMRTGVTANFMAVVPDARVCGDPCTVVLLGATGDLARKKLIGAMYDLLPRALPQDHFHIVPVARDPMHDAASREVMRTAVQSSDEVKGYTEPLFNQLAQKTTYVSGDLTTPAVYAEIAR